MELLGYHFMAEMRMNMRHCRSVPCLSANDLLCAGLLRIRRFLFGNNADGIVYAECIVF